MKIPRDTYENEGLSANAKLVLMYLIDRESLLVSQGKCTKGNWFPASYAAMASPLGVASDTVRQKYIPDLIGAGLISKRASLGFNRREWRPQKTCYYQIRWNKIIEDDYTF